MSKKTHLKYSLCLGSQKKSAKGVTKSAQRNLHHDLFKQVLETGNVVRTTNSRISSTLHQIYTVETRKLSLSAFDDKRFILNDGIRTLPYGHFAIRDIPFLRLIEQDQDWGEVEVEEHDALRALEIDIIESPDWGNNAEEEAEWTVPDPGFYQPHTTDSDYDDEIADLSAINDESLSPVPCEFLDLEAREEALIPGQNSEPTEPPNEEILVMEETRTAIITLDSNSEDETRLPQSKRTRRAIIFDSDSD